MTDKSGKNTEPTIEWRNDRLIAYSTSNPGITYTLTVRDGLVLCECLGFRHRGHCRHEAAARKFIARYPAAPRSTDNNASSRQPDKMNILDRFGY